MIELQEIFDIKYGHDLELNRLDEDKEGINFVSRTSKNNGVSSRVAKHNEIEPYPKGMITVSLGGSVLEAFIQSREFYTGYHMFCLTPKISLSDLQKAFYCCCIRANKYRYSYGRQANLTLKNILVPSIDEIPNWVNEYSMPNFSGITKTYSKKESPTLDSEKWHNFTIGNLFNIQSMKCPATEQLIEGKDVPYIAAKKTNNGIQMMCDKKENSSFISAGNCIVFIQQGQGSAGYALYQGSEFIGLQGTTSCGYNENLNSFNGLFIVAVLDLQRPKYSFGRGWNGERLKNTKIKLPADKNGKPNWQFMEDYVKSLPYSANLETSTRRAQ